MPPVIVKTIDTVDGTVQTLDALPGQFKSTSEAGAKVSGIERVWTSMTVELNRGPRTDYTRPNVSSVSLLKGDTTWTALVDAQDPSIPGSQTGIASMTVTQYGDAAVKSQKFAGVTPAGSVYQLNLDDLLGGAASEDVEVTIDVTDLAGNSTTMTSKGQLITGPPTGDATLHDGSGTTASRHVVLHSNVLHATQMRFSTDGKGTWGDWLTYEASVPVTLPGVPGPKTVDVQYKNETNPRTLDKQLEITWADPTPPTCTASVTPPANAANWNDGDVTVILNPGDAGSGVLTTEYKVGVGGTFAVYPADGIKITSEGATDIYCRVTDDAGNVYEPAGPVATVWIDKTRPTCSADITPAPVGGVNNSDVTVTLTAGDALSGLVKTEYRTIASGVTSDWADHPFGGFPVTADGTTDVYCRVTDAAGNVFAPVTPIVSVNIVRITHTIQVTPPTNGSITHDGETGDAVVIDGQNQEILVTPDSGYRVVDIIVDGTSLFGTTLPAGVTLAGNGDGSFGVSFQAVTADHSFSAEFESITATTRFLTAATAGLGAEGNMDSYECSLSADGRYVAFRSQASNLVPGDTNNQVDVFVRDRTTGVTELVSVAPDGTQANGNSDSPSLSADGRYVAYASTATNLLGLGNDTNGRADIFLYDRFTCTTTRVSVGPAGLQANEYSASPSISANGDVVAFHSAASNLLGAGVDTNNQTDVFVHVVSTGVTECVSVPDGGGQSAGDAGSMSYQATISADGNEVAFSSGATNLVAGPSSGYYDVYVHYRDTHATVRASVGTGGTLANQSSFYPAMSGDGRYVAFASWATNLADGDSNEQGDIFVRDLQQPSSTSLVSLTNGGQQGNSFSDSPAISSDGRYVAFCSPSSNLVSGDTNSNYDVFVRDRTSGTTERVSVASDGTEGNGQSDLGLATISGDGRVIAFRSGASSLVPGDANGYLDVFVRDRLTDLTERVSVTSGAPGDGDHCSISADGRFVAFRSAASDLVAGDTNGKADIFRLDLQTGQIVRVSVPNPGLRDPALRAAVEDGIHAIQIGVQSYAVDHNDTYPDPSIVTPTGLAAYVDPWPEDPYTGLPMKQGSGLGDFRYYISLVGRPKLASNDVLEANGDSWQPCISSDGTYVAFSSDATNLIANDANGSRDVFSASVGGGDVESVLLVSCTGATQGNYMSDRPSISADGYTVAFESMANNLSGGSDTNGTWDVFVHSMLDATTVRASSTGVNAGNSWSDGASLNADGTLVAFSSNASDLLPGDGNGKSDVFVLDLSAAAMERVSVATGGIEATGGNSDTPSISADGRFVAFESGATNLLGGDTNNASDVFVHDRTTDTTECVSVSGAGLLGNQPSNLLMRPGPYISADGRYVVFESAATNLIAEDTNGTSDIFVHDRLAQTTELVSVAQNGSQGDALSTDPAISADGRRVVFTSHASNFVTGGQPYMDVFIRTRW